MPDMQRRRGRALQRCSRSGCTLRPHNVSAVHVRGAHAGSRMRIHPHPRRSLGGTYCRALWAPPHLALCPRSYP